MATQAAAQAENMAVVATNRTQSVLPKATQEAEQHVMLPKDPEICMDCEATSVNQPPLVQFPSNIRALFPKPDGCSYLLFGLLGLLGLGLFALGKLRFTEKDN